METKFYILLHNLTLELRAQVELNLSSRKAIWVDDVEPEWRDLYLALEYADLPDLMAKPRPGALLLGWEVNFDPDELRQVASYFELAKLDIATMLVVMEEGQGVWVSSLDPTAWYEETALFPVAQPLPNSKAIGMWMLRKAAGKD